MDFKWGIPIVAALVGAGLFLVGKDSPVVKEAPSQRRPSMDDIMERKTLEMKTYLQWLKNQNDARYSQKGIDTALETMEKNVTAAQKFREDYNATLNLPEQQEMVLPELKYGTWEDYKNLFGKGNPTSGGPYNYLFDTSGQFKSSTGHAMTLLKNFFPEGKDQPTDEEAHTTIRAIYQDPEVITLPRKEGGLGGMSLTDMGVELWNEQSTYRGRNLMRNRAHLLNYPYELGFNIDAALKFMDTFFIQSTYRGFKMERKAVREMNREFRTSNNLIFYRKLGNFEDITPWNKNPFIGDRCKNDEYDYTMKMTSHFMQALYAPKGLDTTWKTDLLVRIRPNISGQPYLGAKGKAIMGGIQVKPLSFFYSAKYLLDQNWKHQIVAGKAKTWDFQDVNPTSYIQLAKAWMAPRTVETTGKAKTGEAMGFFYVQNLVYDDMGGTDEWLNWDSLMQRLAWNIPDPLHESDFGEKLNTIWSISSNDPDDKKEKIAQGLRNLFQNDEKDWTQKVIRKIKEEEEKPAKNRNWGRVGVEDWSQQRMLGTPQYRGDDGLIFGKVHNKWN